MFSEDDAHNLPTAAKAATAARNKLISAAQSFKRAAELLHAGQLLPEIKGYVGSWDRNKALSDWSKRGIVMIAASQSFEPLALSASKLDLGALVDGFAAKLNILADQLEWPVQNLLSNRYAFRDDMMRVFATVATIVTEAGWLSNFFYELPSENREEHNKWLETLAAS